VFSASLFPSPTNVAISYSTQECSTFVGLQVSTSSSFREVFAFHNIAGKHYGCQLLVASSPFSFFALTEEASSLGLVF
jgi:hypothetical protein